MSSMKNSRKVSLIVLTVLLAFVFGSVNVFALPYPDPEAVGSITIILNDTTAPWPEFGAELVIYQAGQLKVDDADYSWELAPEFEGSGVDLSDLEQEEVAIALAEYADDNRIEAIEELITDDDGKAVSENRNVGLYLIVQKQETMGYEPVMPFLLTIPSRDPVKDTWIYHVDASPKLVFKRLTPGGGKVSSTPGLGSITPSISPSISPSASLTPGGGQNTGTPPLASITPTSNIPRSTVTPSGGRSTVTPTGGRPTTTPSTTLPRTGQLWWPVPLLAVTGLIFIIVGLRKRSK